MVSNLLIEALFENGSSQSVSAFPLRAVYQTIERREGHAPVQILISVPKKRFKHAVDRNRVKRQIREAYRRHRQRSRRSSPSAFQFTRAGSARRA